MKSGLNYKTIIELAAKDERHNYFITTVWHKKGIQIKVILIYKEIIKFIIIVDEHKFIIIVLSLKIPKFTKSFGILLYSSL